MGSLSSLSRSMLTWKISDTEHFRKFDYCPLEPGHIRVLRLEPGRSDDDIWIELSTINLNSSHLAEYETLSYVWGSPRNHKYVYVRPESRRLSVEDKKSRVTISVTANLAIALQHLRNVDGPRTIWIDAICINQEDIGERGEQVKMMGRIYQNAVSTTIWLGPGNKKSDEAMGQFQEWAAVASSDFGSSQVLLKGEALQEYAWMLGSYASHSANARQSRALEDLLFRDWFERVWVQQEVFLSQHRAIVLCGECTMPWQDFRLGLMIAATRLQLNFPSYSRSQVSARLKILSQMCRGFGLIPGLEALEATRDLQCADPRDKVYGILGVLSNERQLEHDQWLIEACPPDYNITIAKLYEKVAAASISVQRRLEFLSYCRSSSEPRDLPSWLPDWRQRRVGGSQIRYQYADAQSRVPPRLHKINESSIRVRGRAVGCIDSLAPAHINTPGGHFSWYIENVPETDYSDILIPLIQTSLENDVADIHRWEEPSDDLEFPDLITAATCFLADINQTRNILGAPEQEDEDPAAMSEIFLSHATAMASRRFAKDKHARPILVPLSARPGDILAVLLGVQPVICLRPNPGGTYSVIGTSFYHDFNAGQGLLGPMPDEWQLIYFHYRIDGASGAAPAFEHIPSGSITTLDPRVDWDRLRTNDPGADPDGDADLYPWETLQDDAENPWSVVLSKKRLGPVSHPDAEYFKAVGVELEDFILV